MTSYYITKSNKWENGNTQVDDDDDDADDADDADSYDDQDAFYLNPPWWGFPHGSSPDSHRSAGHSFWSLS